MTRARGRVDLERISSRTLWNPFNRIAARMGLRTSEEAAIFGGTALRALRPIDPRSSDRDRHG
jgi:hypothetical protein